MVDEIYTGWIKFKTFCNLPPVKFTLQVTFATKLAA